MAFATLAFRHILKLLWFLCIEYLKPVPGYLFYYLFLSTVEKILFCSLTHSTSGPGLHLTSYFISVVDPDPKLFAWSDPEPE